MAIRRSLCSALALGEEEMPFAGELIQVRPEEAAWEGAVERLLHSFGLSLLVPDPHYARVAEWVDRTHLTGRLVYFRVREGASGTLPELHPASLLEVLAGKLRQTEEELDERKGELAQNGLKQELARSQLTDCQANLAAVEKAARLLRFPQMEEWRAEALGEHSLTVESCDNRERDMRDWIQARIDAEESRIKRLRDRIIDAVRRWIRALAEDAKAEGGRGYRLEFREINHRQLGHNSIPAAAWLDTEDDALALIGKRREAARSRELAAMSSPVCRFSSNGSS